MRGAARSLGGRRKGRQPCGVPGKRELQADPERSGPHKLLSELREERLLPHAAAGRHHGGAAARAAVGHVGAQEEEGDVADGPRGPAHGQQRSLLEAGVEGDELRLGALLPPQESARQELKHGAVAGTEHGHHGLCPRSPGISSDDHRQPLPGGVPRHGLHSSSNPLLPIGRLEGGL